jgi:peroxiredoxin
MERTTMPLPPRDFSAIGPKEGEVFPDVVLPDQTGTVVDLHGVRATRRGLVVFHRSAEWWPFCKTQLVELQRVNGELVAEGVALFAISYDSVDILARFAKERGITYPLLSDAGSDVMRRLGLLNPRVQEDHAFYGIAPNPRHVDLPYPGFFVLDRQGLITTKRFHESYRVRDTGGSVLGRLLGTPSAPPPPATIAMEADAVRVRAWLDSPTYAWFQQMHLTVEFEIESGFHIYGPEAGGDYVSVSLRVEPLAGLEIGEVTWSETHLLNVEGLNERVPAYEGRIRALVPLTFTATPGSGDQVLGVNVSFQACSSSSCLLPSSVRLEVPVKEAPLVGRTLPASTR